MAADQRHKAASSPVSMPRSMPVRTRRGTATLPTVQHKPDGDAEGDAPPLPVDLVAQQPPTFGVRALVPLHAFTLRRRRWDARRRFAAGRQLTRSCGAPRGSGGPGPCTRPRCRRSPPGPTRPSRKVAGTPRAMAPVGTTIPPGTSATGPDESMRLDDGIVQHHRVRPDEGVVAHGATLQVGQVSDDAPLPHDGVQRRRGVDHTTVLHRGPGPDLDGPVVPAQDGAGPDRGLRAEAHPPDHRGIRMDVGVGMDVRFVGSEGVDGHTDDGRGPFSPRRCRSCPG